MSSKYDPLEGRLEAACRGYARSRGCTLLKLYAKGWPDRALITPNGYTIYIEFKRPGAVPRPLQQYHIDQLNKMKQVALWMDNLEEFKTLTNWVVSQRQCGLREIINLSE